MRAKLKTATGVIRWYLKTTGFAGITLPPFGIYILAEHRDDIALQNHELVHWQQYQALGVVKFYAKYLWLLLKHGYTNHPMEKEARLQE